MASSLATILILYTGGTIGMKDSEHGYVPMDNFGAFFEKMLKDSEEPLLPNFVFESLDSLIDSANLVPMNWTFIGQKLQSLWEDYDGFVVLHGTDTMAYTASALSFMFQGLNKPVVLTGSQIPMTQHNSDALDNVIHALHIAAEQKINEVSICFDGKILRGNRSTKVKSVALDAFNSPNIPWLGEKDNNIYGAHLELPKRKCQFSVPVYDCNAVIVLHIYPGISAQAFEGIFTSNSFKAIIIQTYGMGNSPNIDSSLLRILKRAADEGVIVVNITQCLVGGVNQATYSTGSHMVELGVVPGSDMTLEAAFAKLHFLIASQCDQRQIRDKMLKSLAGELSL